ncbi:hypothetical protein E2C01_096082 [Portunus trituberculatus]|uniref:Uncharacterized protein n=1 Tax=Portunus trituberculatus TaxID=210409 RepID=A0A5B7K0X4_PORTR|nr:hypothetical protein [Portunus trituberculatus]
MTKNFISAVRENKNPIRTRTITAVSLENQTSRENTVFETKKTWSLTLPALSPGLGESRPYLGGGIEKKSHTTPSFWEEVNHMQRRPRVGVSFGWFR